MEHECYAAVYAVNELKPSTWWCLYTMYTNHKPLLSLFSKEMNNTKIQLWAIILAEYDCKVQYKKGKLNVRADMLSRIRQQQEVHRSKPDHP